MLCTQKIFMKSGIKYLAVYFFLLLIDLTLIIMGNELGSLRPEVLFMVIVIGSLIKLLGLCFLGILSIEREELFRTAKGVDIMESARILTIIFIATTLTALLVIFSGVKI